ncbi:SDR family NAD(P)-dependent oxidoreductase [Actinomadura sp. WMMA1423]|uniref:SDR family NAD(P)-dependent oxidoreductase n=1 Tax=Actinomadura sp. WMMA1423 TaxID=2591108 RepID=UPI001146C489|nr:SDR family oxidoreductase [Actinomadura sp. WMMA1423]
MTTLDRKVAVVYGGGGTVGGAIARAFAREGAQVHVAGRTRAPLDRVVRSITGGGGHAEAALVDAADEDAVRRHLDQVTERTGRLDILVNAVGIPHVQGPPLAELDLDQFMAPIDGYLRTLFVTTKAAAPHLAKQGSGVVLTLSTPGARLTGRGFLGNGVSSAAVEAFSRILAGELGSEGVRVVCLRPHAIPESVGASHVTEAFAEMAGRAGATTQEWLAGAAQGTLLGRLPTPEDVAEYAAFAASDRARTMTGAIANLGSGVIVD